MKNKVKRLAIIPARSGSVRIKNKNIKNFNNKPIIQYTLNNAIQSKLFADIHVSTDSKKITKLIKKMGVKVNFLRPKKLSTDKISLINVLKYVTKNYYQKDKFYDEVWLLYACAPLINHHDLIKASKYYNKTKKDLPLMSMKEFEAPVEWSYKKKNKSFIALDSKKLEIDSKKLEKKYFESGTFVIFPKKNDHEYNFKSKKNYGFVLPRLKAIDIDTLEDWKIAEFLYKYNK
jgi:pseudaminic acid cytidylyltransferase